MFETAYASEGGASRRPWTFTLSLLGEVIVVAALALAPLLSTPEIAGAFESAILLVAPPKPPTPAKPAPPSATAQAAPKRFAAEISAPADMPDHAQRIDEERAQRPALASDLGPGPGVVRAVPWSGEILSAHAFPTSPRRPNRSRVRNPARLIRRLALWSEGQCRAPS